MGSSPIVSDGAQSQAQCNAVSVIDVLVLEGSGSNPEQRVNCRGNGERSLIGEMIFYNSVSKYGDSRSSQDPALEIIEVLLS